MASGRSPPRRVRDAASDLCTEAWLLRGISGIPGELRLSGGYVGFTARAFGSAWPWQLRKLERELRVPGFADAVVELRPSRLFRWPVEEVDAWIPWYYFKGGMKFGREGLVLAFSFGRPANMSIRGGLASAREQFLLAGRMRECGRQWERALGSRRLV